LRKSLKIIRRKLKKNIKRISSLKNGEQKLKLHVELNNENINRKDSLLHAFAKTISKVSVPEKKYKKNTKKYKKNTENHNKNNKNHKKKSINLKILILLHIQKDILVL